MRKAGGLETAGSNPVSPTMKREVFLHFSFVLDWTSVFELSFRHPVRSNLNGDSRK